MGPGWKTKAPGIQVAREQVAGELDAPEARIDRAGDGVGEGRLADPRNVLEQQVPAGEQRLDGASDHFGLAPQRLLDVRVQPLRALGSLLRCEPGSVRRVLRRLPLHPALFGRFGRAPETAKPIAGRQRMRKWEAQQPNPGTE
jgi:hypothetical protein